MTDRKTDKSTLETVTKVGTVLISLAALVWGSASFLLSKRIEARRPYLDYQLALYKETIAVATTLATTQDSEELQRSLIRYCELYWGELALVETPAVESAMVAFKNVLDGESVRPDDAKSAADDIASVDVCTTRQLSPGAEDRRLAALRLAHTLRSSLAASWNVDDWEYRGPRSE